MEPEPEETKGSRNVFADLGFADAETLFLKAKIVSEIHRLTNELSLTQRAAGARMGISQASVSRLFRGHFDDHTIERLLTFLTAFDVDVEIVARPRKSPGKSGRISFTAASP